MGVRILIAEDETLIRTGFVAMLAECGHFVSVESAADGYEVLRLVRQRPPDVILMDVTMPGLNGIETTKQALAECPPVKIIAVSSHDDRTLIVNMLRAGARGYVLKLARIEELIHAIEEVMAGRVYLSPKITDMMVEDYLHLLDEDAEADYALTRREREIVQWLAEGRAPREIADRLFIARKTVETHRRHIMRKLGLKTQADLVKYAIREGIVSVK